MIISAATDYRAAPLGRVFVCALVAAGEAEVINLLALPEQPPCKFFLQKGSGELWRLAGNISPGIRGKFADIEQCKGGDRGDNHKPQPEIHAASGGKLQPAG